MAGNDAIHANPPSYAIDLTTHGSDFLWAIFACMLLSAIAITVMSFTTSKGKRLFHWISAAICFTAAVAYFSMASNLGKTPVLVEFCRQKSDLYEGPCDDAYRSIWYARYIDWTVTTPLLLLDLLLATGLPTSTIFFTIFMDLVMIVTGLIGSLVVSAYKWGFYTGGCIAMLAVFGILVTEARTSAYAMGSDVGQAYLKSACILSFLWFLYPVAWGLADGGNVIPTDSEMVFYGVLDLLAKPVFIFFHLFALRKLDYTKFELTSGHYSVGANESYRGTSEKFRNNVPFGKIDGFGQSNGYSNGHANGAVQQNGTTGSPDLVDQHVTALGTKTHRRHPSGERKVSHKKKKAPELADPVPAATTTEPTTVDTA